jgi:hypothetical protein
MSRDCQIMQVTVCGQNCQTVSKDIGRDTLLALLLPFRFGQQRMITSDCNIFCSSELARNSKYRVVRTRHHLWYSKMPWMMTHLRWIWLVMMVHGLNYDVKRNVD